MLNTGADIGNHGLDLGGGFVGQRQHYFVDPGVAA
jgi:hypothetical protein